MSYRKQRVLRRILQEKRAIPKRGTEDVNFSEKSLQKAKDYAKQHAILQKLPLYSTPGKRKKNLQHIQYQHELRLAKLLNKPKPSTPSKILKLPAQDFSFLEEDN